jgi:ankyrin repeat protein
MDEDRERLAKWVAVAVAKGTPETVALFVNAGADLNTVGFSDDGYGGGTRPLTAAAARGDPDLIKMLISAGATGLDEALAVAVDWGHSQAVKALVDAGADLRSGQENALMTACERGRVELVRLFLDMGLDVNAPDPRGYTPLFRAVSHPRVVQVLLESGANVHYKTPDGGWSALHFAVEHGCAETVKTLLAAGADPSAVSNQGYTPLDVAKHHRSYDKQKILEEVGTYQLRATRDDVPALKAYWAHLAREWWHATSPGEAACDYCNRPMTQGQGYLIARKLCCESCLCSRILSSENLERLWTDPNHLGIGMIQQAREFAKVSSTTEAPARKSETADDLATAICHGDVARVDRNGPGRPRRVGWHAQSLRWAWRNETRKDRNEHARVPRTEARRRLPGCLNWRLPSHGSAALS